MKTLQEALAFVRERTQFVPRIALVLGSGLGEVLQPDDIQCCIPYADIPHFPTSTVVGHTGRFLLGTLQGVPIVVAQGRVHYYEGYEMCQVVMPIRLMRLMGAEALILTNAAGGIRPDLTAGSLMMLTDHIASYVPSPLRGGNPDRLGTRFPDMSHVYDAALSDAVRSCADALNIPLHEGVYLQAPGPQHETPAEIRMYAALGADAVGMSTAAEAIAAVHCGMRVCAVSCITNAAAGLKEQALSHEDVQSIGRRAVPQMHALLQNSVFEMAKIL